jgi:hypothetical protein
MRTFRGLLSVLFLLVAVSIGEGEKPSPALSCKPVEGEYVVGYRMHNGKAYQLVQTVKVSYRLRAL